MLQILKDKSNLQKYFSGLTAHKNSFLSNKVSSIISKCIKSTKENNQKIIKSQYMRTEEEDLDSIFYPPQNTLSTKNTLKLKLNMKISDNNSYFKRNALLGNISAFHRNGGFLRGKLYEKIEENYVEVNSNKTKNQKIIDIVNKNQANSKKESKIFSISEGLGTNYSHNSMIRSPFNKYTFIKIDEKDKKLSEAKKKKNSNRHNKTDNEILHIQKRIQSAMPSNQTTNIHRRIKSSTILRKNNLIVTSPVTKAKNRCNSSADILKGIIGAGNYLKSETVETNDDEKNRNKSIKSLLLDWNIIPEKKFSVIHQNNQEMKKKRLWSNCIHRTKHNMFFFINKNKIN